MPAQMPPNHFHQNSGGGPNPWWNHPNRYGHSMPGVHQKDNMKPNEPGITDIKSLYEDIYMRTMKIL